MLDAEHALESYSWPGNVREVRYVVMKCAVMATDDAIHALDLPEKLQECYAKLPPEQNDLKRLFLAVNGFDESEDTSAQATSMAQADEDDSFDFARGGMLADMEKHLIMKILNQTGGHQERAAQLLGISRRTLSRKLKMYGEENNSQPAQALAARSL